MQRKWGVFKGWSIRFSFFSTSHVWLLLAKFMLDPSFYEEKWRFLQSRELQIKSDYWHTKNRNSVWLISQRKEFIWLWLPSLTIRSTVSLQIGWTLKAWHRVSLPPPHYQLELHLIPYHWITTQSTFAHLWIFLIYFFAWYLWVGLFAFSSLVNASESCVSFESSTSIMRPKPVLCTHDTSTANWVILC